ncbi:MAG: gluconeogenesis factor YvcK family protein [Armatimonadota bacterium]
MNIAGMVVFAAGLSLAFWSHHSPGEWLAGCWHTLTKQGVPAGVPSLTGAILILFGLGLVVWGTRRLIRSFTYAANPTTSGRELVMTMLKERRATPKVRIVGLGGGTGLATLLRGLKTYPVDLTAIVTVSDDGGSSGRLRADLDIPPPGDIRNCLVALADAEPLMETLFQHRFNLTSKDLNGHSLGNLIIAGLSEMTGDFEEAIRKASQVLAVRGTVLPSANRPLVLQATMSDGAVVEGETAIIAYAGTIASVQVLPHDVAPLPEALEAIRTADVIILGPGSIYSSLLPNLLIPGMAEALAASPAIKIFICNVMTQPGESDNFSASRHLEAVLEHLPCENPFDYVVVNLQRPGPEVMALYAEKQQQFVEPDLARLRALGTTPVTGHLLADLHLARHDPAKLAQCILETIARATQ